MGPELDFGTAGLRGPVGAGPTRMNRAVLVRAVRAFADYLLSQLPDSGRRPVIVGYDARLSSRALAEGAVLVLQGAGLGVEFIDQPVPTPLVAFAARVRSASGALVVTASHNPRQDNGLKIYGPTAAQLVAPADARVAELRQKLGSAVEIPGVLPSPEHRAAALARVSCSPDALIEEYLAELLGSLPPPNGSRALKIAYTPLHGVGLVLVRRALAECGFLDLHVVEEQALPDGNFPTAPRPNPELPETFGQVLALAERQRADLVLANDPDADRLAAAAPDSEGRYHRFTGNELAALLADFVLENTPDGARPLIVTSVVTTPLVSAIAKYHGARCERTLTGFKWIWSAALELEALDQGRFVFGCEEALGYSVGHLVRDKDGISAALWLAELAARCRSQGKTLVDRLHELHRRHGAWGSAQRSIERREPHGLDQLRSRVAELVEHPPAELVGQPVRGLFDYRMGASERPQWLGSTELFEVKVGDHSRVLVRPSGTEPKLKIYADRLEPLARSFDPRAALISARRGADALADAVAVILGG